MFPKTKTTTLNIRTYESMGYYWSGYNSEVVLEMIQMLEKDVGFAFSYSTDSKRLYKIYLKNGNKLFTDISGFKKINKAIKEHDVDIRIIEGRKW